MSAADVEASLGPCASRSTVWGHIGLVDGEKFLQFYDTKDQCLTLAGVPEGLDPAKYLKPGDTGCGELP